MAVKYSIPFFDDFNQGWRVDIDLPDYVGAPVELTGVGRVFCQPEWSAGDDPYEPIVNSKVTVQFYNRGGEVNVQELQLLPDMTGRLILYRGTDLWWTGYVIPDGIQRMLQPMPYPITITATDGLAMLKDVPFVLGNNWPMPAGVSNRSPMSFIRYVLYGFTSSPHLGITLPIRFQCDIENVEYGDSAIMGTISWGALGAAWTDFNGNSRTCEYILQGMLRALQCRLMQFGGKWHIQRVNDVVGGTYTWTELGTETGTAPTVTTGVTDMVAGISPTFYPMVNENQVASMKAAYTDVVATYEHYQAENVIPNGSFELVNTFNGVPIYWGFSLNPAARAKIKIYEDESTLEPISIDGRGGKAMIATYPLFDDDPMEQDAEISFDGGLPIDGEILVKRFIMGFTIMPLKGFPFVSQGDNKGEIVWDDNPLKIRVLYSVDDGTGNSRAYYLNEYGFWQYFPTGGYLDITSGGRVGDDFTYNFVGNPLIGNSITLSFVSPIDPNFKFFVNYMVDSSTAGSLYDTIQALTENWLTPLLWSFSINVNSTYDVQLVATYTGPGDGPVYDGYTVSSGKDTILPDMSIPITVDKMHIGDIASIQFLGRGGNTEILLPNPGGLNPPALPTIGKLFMWFYLKEGQEYVLDDVYIRIEENNDVYQSRIQDANRRSNRKTVDLNISSSFSGFMLSNMMTSYDKSNTEFRFTDGKYTGSLTGMTANAMMRYHHLPREIFEGDIYTNGRDWQANHIYLFDGKKYLPLVSRYNIETGVVTLTAIEGADGENEFVEEHYGSNDLILSNT